MSKPNIVLVTTDQQRGDCLGFMKSSHPVMTPHLDQLSHESLVFTRAYSDAPVCVPARTSIMTGQNAYTHGVHTMGAYPIPVKPEETLPGILRAEGYQTHAAGKMHFHPPRARYGFERMRLVPEDYVNDLERTPYAGMYRGHGMGGNEIYPAYSAVPERHSTTNWTIDESIDFLRQRDPQAPFFLWTSFEAPHPPFDPPESYVRLYDGLDIPSAVRSNWSESADEPNWLANRRRTYNLEGLSVDLVKSARKHYYAMITHIDYQLGRLFGELKSQKLWENTIILFTSDHGELLGDHAMFHKSCYLEGAARIPFLLRIPDQCNRTGLRPGDRVHVPVQLSDICPTLASLAGASAPSGMVWDGASLADTEGLSRLQRRTVFGCIGEKNGFMYMAASERWKYIYYEWGGKEQLFDLAADPDERINLAADGDHLEMLQHYRILLLKQFPDLRDEGDATGMRRKDSALPSSQEARAGNPLAWRGPIRYGGGW